MTTATTMQYTILGEEFDYSELQDIAQYGADTGVHGFTYSSDLHEMYDANEDLINDELESLGYTMAQVFTDKEFETLQQYKEWACWAYLESRAFAITEG